MRIVKQNITKKDLERLVEEIPELKNKINIKEIIDLCKSKEKAYAYLLNLYFRHRKPELEAYHRLDQIVIRQRPKRREPPKYNTELELIMKKILEDLELTNYEFQYEVRGYILDFAFPDIKLAIEVGHVRWHPKERDKKKERALSDWKILWFNVNSPKELKAREEEIKRTIKEEIEKRANLLKQ